jgi:hypothetical protein
MTNATVFNAKAWEWNKDSLTIMEMQAAELQALCTRYNLKLAMQDWQGSRCSNHRQPSHGP